jgi:hypothetical protein
MSRILFDSARPVQADPTFGALPYQERRTSYEPSPEDAAWAAALFEELDQARYQAEKDRRLDEMALQAAWDDTFGHVVLDASDFPPSGLCPICETIDFLDRATGRCPECSGRCVVCGVRGETNENAMCDRCDLAAVEGSTTNQPRSFPGAL